MFLISGVIAASFGVPVLAVLFACAVLQCLAADAVTRNRACFMLIIGILTLLAVWNIILPVNALPANLTFMTEDTDSIRSWVIGVLSSMIIVGGIFHILGSSNEQSCAPIRPA